jgi:hypothetical protein
MHSVLLNQLDMPPAVFEAVCMHADTQGMLSRFNDQEISFKPQFARKMLDGAIELYRWYRHRSSAHKYLSVQHYSAAAPVVRSAGVGSGAAAGAAIGAGAGLGFATGLGSAWGAVAAPSGVSGLMSDAAAAAAGLGGPGAADTQHLVGGGGSSSGGGTDFTFASGKMTAIASMLGLLPRRRAEGAGRKTRLGRTDLGGGGGGDNPDDEYNDYGEGDEVSNDPDLMETLAALATFDGDGGVEDMDLQQGAEEEEEEDGEEEVEEADDEEPSDFEGEFPVAADPDTETEMAVEEDGEGMVMDESDSDGGGGGGGAGGGGGGAAGAAAGVGVHAGHGIAW